MAITSRRTTHLLLDRVSSGIVPTGPELADLLLLHFRHVDERRISERRVNLLATEMLLGQFRLSEVRIIVVNDPRADATTAAITNGHHRLTAVGVAKIAVPFRYELVEETDPAAVGRDYAVQDLPASVRNAEGALFALRVHEDLNVNKRELRAAAAAYKLVASGFTNTPADPAWSPRLMADELIAWRQPIDAYLRVVREARPALREVLHLRSVMAPGLVICRYQPDAAAIFWRLVAENDATTGDVGVAGLLDKLISAAGRDWQAVMRDVAAGWSRSFTGKAMPRAAVNTPWLNLAGTPFDGHHALRYLPGRDEPIVVRSEEVKA